MKYITEKRLAAIASTAAVITALVALGPCASKDYVDIRIKEAKAETQSVIDRSEQTNQESRTRVHGELVEIRSDVKQILTEIGELKGALNAERKTTNKAIKKKIIRGGREAATACR